MPAHELPPKRARFCLAAASSAVAVVGLNLGPGDGQFPIGRPSSAISAAAAGASSNTPAGPSDDELRQMILGRWRTNSDGGRVVVNRPDGTASMDVTFDFVASLIYGQGMKLELTWTVNNGILGYTIQSGTPESTVKSITATYGAYASYHFQSISPDRMHLVRVIDPNESYVWTRVATAAAVTPRRAD